jgi:hypothetical protein
MNAHTNDTMARLGAADPARDLPVEEADRARLWQLVEATPAGRAPKPARLRLPLAQLRLALALPALLVLVAGPLAASGVIRIWASAEPVKSLAAPPRGGNLASGTVYLLPLAAPGPGANQSWGPWPGLAPGPG